MIWEAYFFLLTLKSVKLSLDEVLLDEFTRPSLLMTVLLLVRYFLLLFRCWLTANEINSHLSSSDLQYSWPCAGR